MADSAAASPSATAALVSWTPPTGLSSAQVAERRSRGLTNAGGERTSRSVAEILRANILTRFNLILGVLLAVILVWGEPPDALFGIVLVTNALIGNLGAAQPSRWRRRDHCGRRRRRSGRISHCPITPSRKSVAVMMQAMRLSGACG